MCIVKVITTTIKSSHRTCHKRTYVRVRQVRCDDLTGDTCVVRFICRLCADEYSDTGSVSLTVQDTGTHTERESGTDNTIHNSISAHITSQFVAVNRALCRIV